MTPIELRTDLITILGDKLGTYTTKVGKVYPAIWITPPLVDPSIVVTGLQVLIFRSPEVQRIEPLTAEKLNRYWWAVELTQFDVNESTWPALEIIKNYYPVTTIGPIKQQTRTDYEQARISIYDPRFSGKSGGYA